MGGAFGVSGTEGFIVSGSEDGTILFWDAQNKNVVQRVTGHEGVVLWVDTCPETPGTIASGGLDGTVRIWVDVEHEETIGALNLEDENAIESHYDNQENEVDMGGVRTDEVKFENGAYEFEHDTPKEDMSIDGDRSSDKERPSPDDVMID